MIENNWQSVWNKRKTIHENLASLSERELVLELKRLDGFDVGKTAITYESFVKEAHETVEYLSRNSNRGGVQEIFEVGCGSGANLYLFHSKGIQVGGIDYSNALIEIANLVPTLENMRECICDEAINTPVEIQYDAVVSVGVFHYFPDLEYAEGVLKKMLQKSKYSIGIVDIHDTDKKEEFLNYRRQLQPNYDEYYRGLPKLFYNKKFFEQFAESNNLELCFTESYIENFWDNPYIYNCFMYKK